MQKSDQPQPVLTRGRPRAFDRGTALGKAMRLFWQKGYSATSISDLTEAMGIGSPSLYAAFGSKEALYGESVRHYGNNYEACVWSNFAAAKTAREAIEAYLMDSASALTGGTGSGDPLGCMVMLSAVGSEGHAALGDIVKSARAHAFERIEQRLARAVTEGEFAAPVDLRGLARFVLTVQSGMSIQARDGATRDELETVAHLAMMAWDARSRS